MRSGRPWVSGAQRGLRNGVFGLLLLAAPAAVLSATEASAQNENPGPNHPVKYRGDGIDRGYIAFEKELAQIEAERQETIDKQNRVVEIWETNRKLILGVAFGVMCLFYFLLRR